MLVEPTLHRLDRNRHRQALGRPPPTAAGLGAVRNFAARIRFRGLRILTRPEFLRTISVGQRGTNDSSCWLVGPFFAMAFGLVGRSQERSSSAMCDYSLHHVKSRPAKVGDKLTTHNFNTGTCGFAAPEDSTMAVCILPGTELAFSAEVLCAPSGLFRWKTRAINSRTAIFRQINKNAPHVHHDALEFPDGTFVLLTDLDEGQQATVLQLPAQPKTPAEKEAQTRLVYVG